MISCLVGVYVASFLRCEQTEHITCTSCIAMLTERKIFFSEMTGLMSRITVYSACVCALALASSNVGTSCSIPLPSVSRETCQETLRFVSIGDSGQVSSELSSTARSMQIIYQTQGFDFVSMLGDLAYPGGFSASPEKEFRELFTEPFEGIHVPFYPVLGDNDYGSDEVQSSFSSYLHFREQDPRWAMEGLYYHHIHEKGDVSVCAIHIDTQSMVKVLYPESRTAEELELLSAQLPWLEDVLSSRACQETNFIIVFAHNPLISASRKGNKGSTSRDLRSILLPLFTRYHVDAYFSGHDHDLQALTYSDPSEHVISFIVSGSSSRLRTKTFNGPLDGIDVWRTIDTIGFTVSEVTKESMVTRFVASDEGGTLHTHTTVSHRRLRVPGGSS